MIREALAVLFGPDPERHADAVGLGFIVGVFATLLAFALAGEL